MFLAGILFALGPTQAAEPSAAEAPRARGWDDFPVFVWREKYAGKPLPEELIEPFGGVILMREEDSSWARERGLSYLVWNVAGRDALHLDADEAWNARVEQWIRTRDEKLLVREPCMNDPKTIEKLFATLDATIAKHGERPGLGFVLGDEVSLTPNGDPFDLCRCEYCETKWKEYAKTHALPQRAPLTDEVRRALLEDDYSLLGPWLARRRFDQESLLGLLEQLIDRVYGTEDARERWELRYLEGRVVGLLGCAGQTAFGGVGLEHLATSLGFIECYPVSDARELVETVPSLWRHIDSVTLGPDPRPQVLATIFLEGESPAGLGWLVWNHWLRGGNGLVLWNDAQLEALPPAHRMRLTEALNTSRSLGEWRDGCPIRPLPRPGAIALLHDPDSAALSFLRDSLLDGATWPRRRAGYQEQNGSREHSVSCWLRLLEDSGCWPASLPLSKLCDHCRYRFPVLILPSILAVDEREATQLERHVQGGGTLVIDGPLAWVDHRGARIHEDTLERLESKYPDKVLRAPRQVAEYLETRSDLARGEIARDFVRRLETWGLPAPALHGEAATIPWLTEHWGANERRGLILLPNCPTKEERQHRLRDIPLELTAPDGFTIEWIHPVDGKLLRAGDAAVLELRPAGEEPR